MGNKGSTTMPIDRHQDVGGAHLSVNERLERLDGQVAFGVERYGEASGCGQGILLGSVYNAREPQQLQHAGVTHILVVAEEVPVYHEGDERYDGIAVQRHVVADLVGDEPQHDLFRSLSEYLKDVAQQGGCTLVHCMRGRSRSAAVVIAHHMLEGMTLREAYAFVKKRRGCIGPHGSLKAQLIDFERELYGGRCTMDLAVWRQAGYDVPADWRQEEDPDGGAAAAKEHTVSAGGG